MALRTFAISVGSGLLLSSCTGAGDDAATDETMDTGESADTGDGTDTGTASEADITGGWDLVTWVYTYDGYTETYTFPYVYNDSQTGDVETTTVTVDALADGTGTATYATSIVYGNGDPTYAYESPIGLGWTRTGSRSFDLVFDEFVPPMACDIPESDDNAMSCVGTDADGAVWTWELTR